LRFSIIVLLISILSPEIFAEYRVYQYYVKSTLPSLKDQQAKLVTSSLNPVSYVAYHGGSDVIQVDLLRSWMCYGHTGNKEICSPPDLEIKSLPSMELSNENQ
jgi:hemolysin-activating ACP:hemolysin acyltransferase